MFLYQHILFFLFFVHYLTESALVKNSKDRDEERLNVGRKDGGFYRSFGSIPRESKSITKH